MYSGCLYDIAKGLLLFCKYYKYNYYKNFIKENLAFGKQTDQNSTEHGGVSSRGVDGISITDWNGKSCTHTQEGEDKPWWRVDLGQVEPVSEVYIVNRDTGSWGNRLSNFEIRVGRLLLVFSYICCR